MIRCFHLNFVFFNRNFRYSSTAGTHFRWFTDQADGKWCSAVFYKKINKKFKNPCLLLPGFPLWTLLYIGRRSVLTVTSNSIPIKIFVWQLNSPIFRSSCMYTYYAVRSIGFRVPKPLAMSITLLQIAQVSIAFFLRSFQELLYRKFIFKALKFRALS